MSHHVRFALPIAVAAFTSYAPLVQGEQLYLKYGDIEGESTFKGYEDQIEVLAWSWGVSNSGTTHIGGGGGTGKANIQDVVIVKYTDKASVPLLADAIKGEHVGEAILHVVTTGGESPIEYTTIKMSDVIVTSFSTGGRSYVTGRATENVTLNFGKVEFTYTSPDGKAGGGDISTCWDIVQNVGC